MTADSSSPFGEMAGCVPSNDEFVGQSRTAPLESEVAVSGRLYLGDPPAESRRRARTHDQCGPVREMCVGSLANQWVRVIRLVAGGQMLKKVLEATDNQGSPRVH